MVTLWSIQAFDPSGDQTEYGSIVAAYELGEDESTSISASRLTIAGEATLTMKTNLARIEPLAGLGDGGVIGLDATCAE